MLEIIMSKPVYFWDLSFLDLGDKVGFGLK